MSERFKLEDIKDAYRKLKSYFYYDNASHFYRRKIADFEDTNIDLKLEDLHKALNKRNPLKSERIQCLIDEVSYYVLPKSFENNISDKDNLIVTNRHISEYYQLKDFNFFIDLPVELHIINVLWIVKLGYLLDTDYCHYSDKNSSYCYANKLELHDLDKDIKLGNKLFKPYHKQYQEWRDDCLKAAEDLLENHEKDIIIMSLDVKKYYPTAELDFTELKIALEQKWENKFENDCNYKNYSFLTDIIEKISKRYTDLIFQKFEDILEEKKYSKKLIPIGMLSSNIIANWYLKDFDKDILLSVKPAFYGRYVDDILIVLENTSECNKKSCDRKDCMEVRKLSVDKILQKYFCNCGQDICGNKISKEDISYHKNCNKEVLILNKDEKDKNIYEIARRPKSIIQGNKVKLFVFDANSSKALLVKFRDNIRKHSSEFRFLPEDDRIYEDLVNESYSIDYSDTINKIRSIEKCQLDKFKISTYLAKQLMLAKYCKDNKHFQKTKEELMYSFNGRMGLELSCYWDKVLTYFLINKNEESFIEFINTILKNISRIEIVGMANKIEKSTKESNEKEILNEIKVNLHKYLLESIYLALALNPTFIIDYDKKLAMYEIKQKFKNKFNSQLCRKLNDEITIKAILEANQNNILVNNIEKLLSSKMIKHKYCFMPILNFIEEASEDKFINLTDENILFKLNKQNNLKNLEISSYDYNPKPFSIDEIMLFEIYRQINENQQDVNIADFFEKKGEQDSKLIEIYAKLNLKQFYQDNDLENSYYKTLKDSISKRFDKIVYKEGNDNKKPIIDFVDSNFPKPNIYKINVSDYKPNMKEFRIGLYNTKISDDSIEKNLKKEPKLCFDELQSFIRFLNLAIQKNQPKCDLIVFPEICLPFQSLGLLTDFVKKHNVAIICGLKHIVLDGENKDKNALNYIATILPMGISGYTDAFINLRLKKWYAPAESKLIKKLGLKVPETKNVSNDLFIWNNLYFAVYDCFELVDIRFRAMFKADLDFLVACEWNKDIKYFNNIVESAARDLHCYVIQVNTSQYGDSKIVAPKKSEESIILNIKGGEDNILIGKIDIDSLRKFQSYKTDYIDKDEFKFKALPPDFKPIYVKRLSKY